MIAKLTGYILTLVAAGMLVAGVQSLIQLPRLKQIARLAGGCLLLVAVLAPVVSIEIDDLELPNLVPQLQTMAELEEQTQQQMNQIIKERCESYILDKADSLGATISAEVELRQAEEGYGVPQRATIAGVVTPRQRQALSAYIEQDLGIPPDRQIWRTI